MKKWVTLVFVLGVVIALSINANSRNDGEIEELFGEEDEIDVIVVLEDNPRMLKKAIARTKLKSDLEKRKEFVKSMQDYVLSDLRLKRNLDENKLLEENNIVPIQPNDDYDFTLNRSYSTINAFSGKIKKSSFLKLKNNPNIKSISKNGYKSLTLPESRPIVNATNTWRLLYQNTNITGRGISVCVIDSGIDYTHPNLGNCTNSTFLAGNCSKVISGYDYKNDDYDPFDDQGHGTHVAGIVASNDSTNRGVAPDATLVALKVCDSTAGGNCADSDIISAIDWCVNNASIFNISVISMSLGGGSFTSNCNEVGSESGYATAIDAAYALNISVTAASGNDGSSSAIVSPACIGNATAVASSTNTDSVSSFSNRNGITDLFAPGSSITSTVPEDSCINCDASGFNTLSGTSMATPHVAGVLALLYQFKKLEQNISLLPFTFEDALNDTGKQIDDTDSSGFIFSRVNVYDALLFLDTSSPNLNLVIPLNNTNTSNMSFVINITSDEILSSAILEFNSTNESIPQVSTFNYYLNKTVSSTGVFNYRIYTNDSSNNRNDTEEFQIAIDNSAPVIIDFYPSERNRTIAEPNNFTFNVTYNDTDFDQITVNWFENGTLKSTNDNFTFLGNFSRAGIYNITVVISDDFSEHEMMWNFTVNNTDIAPSVLSASLNSSDFENRTNGTLQASFAATDEDGDTITMNETLWYINGTLNSNFTNQTSINSTNITRLESFIFSARVFAGNDWSEFLNSTTLVVKNSIPSINITNLTVVVEETDVVNISLNGSDLDFDPLTFTTNESLFSILDNHLIWYTNLTHAGFHSINITINDSNDIDSVIVNLTIEDVRDLDGDGIPDYNDTDDDNDGINDTLDFLVGNLTTINSTSSINLTINGTTNFSQIFNGTLSINITNGSQPIIQFNFTFNSSNVLDLSNLTINRSTNGSAAVSIRGNLNLGNSTKTIFLEKVNTSVRSVCIKDEDASFENISSDCDSSNENLITCNNQTSGGYTCFDTGSRYKITGLNNSAIKEQCRDSDGDGYGTGCALGNDCDDSDSSRNTDCSSGSGSSGGGGGGGGSGGGGGGGGGAGPFSVCNNRWECGDWSECDGRWQVRECNLLDVPQYTTNETSCPSLDNAPAINQRCVIEPEKQAVANESCNDGILNQDEENTDCGGVCEPCLEEGFKELLVQPEVEEVAETKGFGTLLLILGLVGMVGAYVLVLYFVFRGVYGKKK